MKSSARLLLIAAAVGLVMFFGWNVSGQQTAAPQVVWEHAVIHSTGDNSSRLSQAGEKGWELVAVRSEEKVTTGGSRQVEVTYYLKRSRPAGQ